MADTKGTEGTTEGIAEVVQGRPGKSKVPLAGLQGCNLPGPASQGTDLLHTGSSLLRQVFPLGGKEVGGENNGRSPLPPDACHPSPLPLFRPPPSLALVHTRVYERGGGTG